MVHISDLNIKTIGMSPALSCELHTTYRTTIAKPIARVASAIALPYGRFRSYWGRAAPMIYGGPVEKRASYNATARRGLVRLSESFSCFLFLRRLPSLYQDTMSFRKIITLSAGAPLPQIGLGTWLSKPNEVENAVCLVFCDFHTPGLSLHCH